MSGQKLPTVADLLTSLRLILLPFFVYYFLKGEGYTAVIIFAVAGITDLVDGTIARLLNQPSKFGAVLDPVADKLLMATCFCCLTFVDVLPWWFLVLAVGRDAGILGGFFYLERRHYKFMYKPLWISKFATFFQLTTAVLGLMIWWRPELNLADAQFAFAFRLFFTATAILIFSSGVQYYRLWMKIIRRNTSADRQKTTDKRP